MYVVCVFFWGGVIFFFTKKPSKGRFFPQLLSKSWPHKINFCATQYRMGEDMS